jgi:hypothetical protein
MADAAPGESLVGSWQYLGEPELLVEISGSAGVYTVTALEDTHVADSTCPLPAGTVLETFSEAGSGYTGEAGLWNRTTCAFAEWGGLQYAWEGERLVGSISGCGGGCGPVLVRAKPLVTDTTTTAKEVSATVSGSIDPMRQATEYHLAFDPAASGYCASPPAAGATGSTAIASLPYTDHIAHTVAVSVEGLTPATRYCARITATNSSGTSEGDALFFTTSPTATKPPNEPPVPSLPPVVSITSRPPKETADQTAAFGFTGVAGGTFQCSVDDGPWTFCESRESFGPLSPGDHEFQVKETLKGLTGPPASYSWTIDLPKACILKVARARVFAFTHQDKARLVIHYKAYRPAQVTVSYSLAGAKGGLSLGTASTRFKTAGVYRLAEKLNKPATAKLTATSSMKVRFAVPQAPARCTRYYTKQLTIPKKIFGQTTWFQSDSIFGASS